MRVGWLMLAAASALSAERLQFEVAAIKPAAPLSGGAVAIGTKADPGRVTYNGVPLTLLIMNAYKVKRYQITGGPDWLNSERFDVIAKLPEGAKQDQVPDMLQSLLENRFGLKLHHDTKELPLYELTVGKGGPKFKASEEDPAAKDTPAPLPPPNQIKTKDGIPQLPPGRKGTFIMMRPGAMTLVSNVATLSDFANRLADQLGTPVVDKTGLSGTYDFSVNFAPEPGQGLLAFSGPPPPAPGAGGAAGAGAAGPRPLSADPQQFDAPPLPAAVQEQLGLKLEKKKGPVDILVIEHIEKTPSEN
jgi:uncharacterized protein (TIGR03435 family)